jgi:hypothetical protein
MNEPTPDLVPQHIVITASDSRLYIMISSTTVDLPEHRHETSEATLRMGHTPLMMERGSAEWNSDAIKFSLEKVEKSQVYIGIFGLRYGHIPNDPIRNPDRLSITEMEYRHAKKLGIPTLIYIAKKTHVFTEEQIDFEPEKREKLKRFKDELGGKCIRGAFGDPAELRSLVLQSLHELEIKLKKPTDEESKIITAKLAIPAPPEVYAVPEYKLTNNFVGRSSELDGLDAWAKSGDTIMVVEGIGGLGKSAVTWEWMQRRATAAIPKLAGRIWWSFYEKGTSMVTFVRHALAYVTGQDPESLIKGSSHYQRGQQLLTELRRRPFLLVLDGFERVLTAYHRLDKAQIPDDQIDTDLRDCINPPDGELLTQLLGCGPSKILISTRLFPIGLEDRGSHKPIPGVVRHLLNGLSPPDALALMRQSGVTGDEKEMLAFAEQFGRHSLLLRIVCGMIADYRKKPYDFDAWHADPIYGGGLKLSEMELKQRYTHILHYALRGLNEQTQKLLSRIAVISENATYDTLAVLNPFLPPRPMEVKEPSDPSKSWRWGRLPDEEKEKQQSAYREAMEAFRKYVEAVLAYPVSVEYRQGVTAFDAALKELENRGLLQWDRDSNRYEMHPVVRGHAAELLEENDKTETFLKVRNHFASLPPDNLDTATELAHLTHSLEIYRCLVGAGRLDEAASFYSGGLSRTIRNHVGANFVTVELLKPLFRNDLRGIPCLESISDQCYVLIDLACAFEELGHAEDSIGMVLRSMQLELQIKYWSWAVNSLRHLRECFARLNRISESVEALSLARELAKAAEDVDGVSMVIYDQMAINVFQGHFAEAAALNVEFCQRLKPSSAFYVQGDAEYLCCQSRFYQGKLTNEEWQAGYDLAVRHRNVVKQYQFLALRAEWDLSEDRPQQSLEAIEQAMQIIKKLGTPTPRYHDLRAWALAKLGRTADTRTELEAGSQGLFAAETYLVLGEPEQARKCTLNAYRRAWGEGPPYIHWYNLERSRAHLKQLGEPEPQLPPFDPSKVQPIPYEKEIRAAIERLKAERAKKEEKRDS